ncbi:MAG: SdpI family protein [Firmicutes bacterium]|nr:SdpI family protein [Bacillota bacterium]
MNRVYGYRTRRSLKSEEAWKFAHAHYAKVSLWSGSILLLLSLLFCFFFKKRLSKLPFGLA